VFVDAVRGIDRHRLDAADDPDHCSNVAPSVGRSNDNRDSNDAL
jgi:hypothetical protein